MPGSLAGKVAIVTGVSNDGQVGQAVAKALAAQGASLAIAARTKDNVVARAAELKAEGANVIPVVASLTDEAQVKHLVSETASAFGRIDIVVFLRDPMTAQPHDPDITALVRACDVHDVPVATNVATARMLLDDLARNMQDIC